VDIALLDELTSGGVLMGAGRFADAAAAYGSALMTARAAGHTLSALQAMTGLASVAAAQEDLNGMRQWSERVIEESSRTPWVASPRLLPAHVLAAWASFQALDTGRARTRNEVALRMLPEIPEDPAGSDQGAPGETAGEAASETAGSASPARRGIEQLGRLARLLQAYLDLDESGDAPGARREVAERIMTSARVVRSLSMTDSMAGAEMASMHRLVVLAGFPRLALEVEQLCARMLVSRHELAMMTATRLLGSGDDAGARASVASVLAADPASLPLRTAVTARLVRAVVAHRNAQPSVAHEALVEALGLAAPQHALRMVLQVAPEVVEVLTVGAGRFGALEPFAQELLDHPHGAAAPVGDRPLDVALSVRELTLLRELPSLLTVSEIASARVVSPNTVKTQLRSLFQKLGVNSRRDAVAAARRLGLL
jgi:DNA-binding CsgD family transcriptional regulator